MHVTIPALSDWHAHYRQGPMLARVCPYTARYAGRTLAMPNTTPPVSTAAQAVAYADLLRKRMPGVDVLAAVKLLPTMTPEDVRAVGRTRVSPAVKLYPAGATTHSADGVPQAALADPERHTWLGDLLDVMQSAGLVLCLHGEMPAQPDPLRREEDFLPFVDWVLDRFPRLRVVLEHITTREAVTFVADRSTRGHPLRLAATITPQHMLFHLGHLLGSACDDDWGYGDGKLHPHNFCWPVVKPPPHRDALVLAALSGAPCFFLGSDTAPHPAAQKESDCGCAGIFSAPVLPEVLVEFFDDHDALGRLPHFATHFGDRFYGRPRVPRTLRMLRDGWTVPASLPAAGHAERLVPFLAGRRLRWRLVADGVAL